MSNIVVVGIIIFQFTCFLLKNPLIDQTGPANLALTLEYLCQSLNLLEGDASHGDTGFFRITSKLKDVSIPPCSF
jgi:hypothetical protein